MKVTIDIPDELLARFDVIEKHIAGLHDTQHTDLTADVRQALADAHAEQAVIFSELAVYVQVDPLRTVDALRQACVLAHLAAGERANHWRRSATDRRAHGNKGSGEQ